MTIDKASEAAEDRRQSWQYVTDATVYQTQQICNADGYHCLTPDSMTAKEDTGFWVVNRAQDVGEQRHIFSSED